MGEEFQEISVLIVDDSALMRNLVGRIVDSAAGLKTAGKAMNGVFALQKIEKLDPDVIVLDLEMPEMNGIQFLEERKKRGIDIPVIILSSLAQKGAKITMDALSLGASDFIMKPSGSVSEDIHAVSDSLITLLKGYGEKYQRLKRSTKKAKSAPSPAPRVDIAAPPPRIKPKAPPPKEAPRKKEAALECIAIGISTGGPNALRHVFSQLDKDLPLPILVVQHMPPGFTVEFAKSLDRICPLSVSEAKEGDLVKPGRVLIAPGNKHIEIEKRRLASMIHLSDAPPVNGHRPSADILFASVAKEYKEKAMAVIMTGMGRDGAKEIGTIHELGGITLAQDEASCVVYGMPKSAIEAGVIQHVVALDKMAETISELAKKHS